MKTTFKTIREYLYQKDKIFVIPNYQRGYKWAVKNKDKDNQDVPSAVEKLISDLIQAYNRYKESPQSYFIQGITVSEKENEIILIDGQQRTTTLYFLLKCLSENETISNGNDYRSIIIDYKIREESKEFIKKLKEDTIDLSQNDDDIQDIYYFKEAIKQINNILTKEITSEDVKNEFHNYILDYVNIMYIKIDIEKATKTFTMMNGNKATMLTEELIKAEMLRQISMPETKEKKVSTSVEDNLADLKEIISYDWETNAIRSRYAREWDKWLYWWNNEDVKKYFNINNPMGLLLEYYYKRENKKNKKNFNFNNFKLILKDKKEVKNHFKGIRDLQKSFEDIYNNPQIYNFLALSLINIDDDKFNTINYFIDNKKDTSLLEKFAKWRMIEATSTQIKSEPDSTENEKSKEYKAVQALQALKSKFVYNSEGDSYARMYLLYLNVLEDNKLNNNKGRKFDFSIFGNQSLEHIHPKSKAFHKDINSENYYDGNGNPLDKNKLSGNEWLNRDECSSNISEHCIGNLVLLDKNENSEFGDKSFIEKKKIFFNTTKSFKSRNLLHTISIFAKEKWGKDEIEKNYESLIDRFIKDYEIELNDEGENKNE